jgi:hypothetical protein
MCVFCDVVVGPIHSSLDHLYFSPKHQKVSNHFQFFGHFTGDPSHCAVASNRGHIIECQQY